MEKKIIFPFFVSKPDLFPFFRFRILPAAPKNQFQSQSQVHPRSLKNSFTFARQKAATKFFTWLLRQHERRDPHKIFLEQVTDQIAPGYSLVIKNPMCFNEIRNKISKKFYSNVEDIKKDFVLTFENCILYNTSDTIYHEFGKKMLNFTKKLMVEERMIGLAKELPFLRTNVTKEELESILCVTLEQFLPINVVDEEEPVAVGPKDQDFNDIISTDEDLEEMNKNLGNTYDPNQPPTELVPVEQKIRKKPGRKPKNFNPEAASNEEKSKNNLPEPEKKIETVEDVARDAALAAKLAREKLAKIRPGSTMGFLKRKGDGSVSYNVLIDSHIEMAKKRRQEQNQEQNQEQKGSHPNQKEKRELKLIDTIGKIRPGCGKPTLPTGPALSTTPMIAKKFEPVTPVDYIDYGPFGSFSPVINNQMYEKYNSSEMAILRAAYDSPTGALYAESALNFVQDSASWVTDYVDRIIDGFTGKKHLTYREYVDNQQKIAEKVEGEIGICKGDEKCPEKVPKEKLDELRSLEKLGIDVSFLDGPKVQGKNLHKSPLAQSNQVKGTPKSRLATSEPDREPTHPDHPKFSLQDQAEDLKKLRKMQDNRFAHSSNSYGNKDHLRPSDKEYKIVGKLENNFRKMIGKNAKPGQVVGREGVRSGLGIAIRK